ncbi:MAG: VWA domain-containing protein [Chloroflexi bacterium]|nr:VWA domain-containing protein [Chloroflexota bacterium]
MTGFRNSIRKVIWLATLATALFGVSSATPVAGAGGASIEIAQIDASEFPLTVAYATVLSDRGYPITGLTRANFDVLENGAPAKIVSVAAAVDYGEPLATVLALDVSGSMSSAIGAEKAAARSFVEDLREQDQASVIAFSSEVRLAIDLTEDKGALQDAISRLPIGGNTALYDALFASVDATTRARAQRRVVILMTDGRNTKSAASLDDGLRLAAQLGVPVYTIGLGTDLDRDALNRIARQTGAMSLFAPTPEGLRATYRAITDQLRNQYVISWESPAPRGAGGYRLSVTANAGGEKITSERTFQASPAAPAITGLGLRDGQRLEGTLPVSMEVSSTLPVLAAKMLVNGRTIEELAFGPFEFSLDASRLSAGRQEVTFAVVDAAGSEVSRRVQVLVAPMAVSVDEGSASSTASVIESSELAGRGFHIPAWPQPALPVIVMPEMGAWGSGLISGSAAALDGLARATGRTRDQVLGFSQRDALKVGALGLLFVAALTGLFGLRKAVAMGRQKLESVVCGVCDVGYRATEAQCPACAEREERAILAERDLGEFLVENNILSAEKLGEVLQRSRETGRGLELTALEEGLTSVRELSKARFYLDHSEEIRGRIHDASHAKRRGHSGRQHVVRTIPAAMLPVLLLVSSITAWTVALPLV